MKLIDFGMSYKYKKYHEEYIITNKVYGSPRFIVREYYSEMPEHNYKSDIFSIGAILYFLLTSKTVFEGTYFQLCTRLNYMNESINFDHQRLWGFLQTDYYSYKNY